MECKRVLTLLYHLSEVSSEEQNKIQQHIRNCSSCRKAYQDFQKLEEVLSDYFSFPAPSQDLGYVQSLPVPKIAPPHQVTFLFAASVLVSLLCVFLISPNFAPKSHSSSSDLSDLRALSPKTFVYTSSLWTPGTSNPLIIAVDQFGTTQTDPKASAVLTHSETKAVYPIFESLSIHEGMLRKPVNIPPNLPNGNYELKIVTVSAKDNQPREYHSQIKVAPSLKLFLQTDKPRYQSSQEIHLHALLLNPQKQGVDFEKLSPIQFTVQDPKGNPVFQKEIPLNKFGAAWCSFLLADEISLGEYTISAQFEDQTLRKKVLVDRYELPKMIVQLNTNREYYAPNEKMEIDIRVRYPYGKPVPNATLSFELLNENGYRCQVQEFESAYKTDLEGVYKFSIAGSSSRMLGKSYLAVTVNDEAKQVAYQTKTIYLAESPYTVHCIPEGGTLRLGLENKLFCITTLPNGKPVKADLTFHDGLSDIQISTPENGVAEWSFSPHPEQIRNENNQNFYEISYKMTSDSSSQKRSLKIPIQTQTEQLLVTLDKAIYNAGEPFVAKIFGSTPISSVFLTLSQEGLLLSQQEIPSSFDSGKTLQWNSIIPPGISGNLSLTVTQLLPSGQWIEDGRIFFVKPSGLDLTIEKKQKDPLRPKESLDIFFKASEMDPATNQSKPLSSGAIAVAIVDESVFAFPAKNLAQLYYELENRLRQSQISILNGEVLDKCLGEEALKEAQQNTAKALYATLEPKSHFVQFGDPFKTRAEQEISEKLLAENLLPYLLDHSFMLKDTDPCSLDPHLFSQMIFKLNLPLDPFLAEKTIVLQELLKHPSVDPAIKGLPLQQIPKKISLLRRESLNRLAQEASSSQEFKQLLREKNIPEERTLTPEGSPIAVHFKAKDTTPSTSSPPLKAQLGKVQDEKSEEKLLATTDQPSQPSNNELLAKTEQESESRRKGSLDKLKNLFFGTKGSVQKEETASSKTEASGSDAIGKTSTKKLEKSLEGGPAKGDKGGHDIEEFATSNQADTGKDTSQQQVSHPSFHVGQKQQGQVKNEDSNQKNSLSDGLIRSEESLTSQELKQLYSEVDRLDQKEREKTKSNDPKKPLSPKTPPESTEDGDEDDPKPTLNDPEQDPYEGVGPEDEAPNTGAGGGGETSNPTPSEKEKNLRGRTGKKQKAIPVELEKMIRFRKYFPETLLFEPSVLIENGKGHLHISKVPDSMTTFRIDATLSTPSGTVGHEKSHFEIFQPFFVDLNVPPSFTVNDDLYIPIILHNYSDHELEVILRVNQENWFQFLPQEENFWEKQSEFYSRVYRIPSQKVHMLEFPIHVLKAGQKNITVSAVCTEEKLTDGITKNILVLPEGQKRIHGSNYFLTTSGSLNWFLPEKASLEETQVLLQIYPDLLSHLRNASVDIDSVTLGGLEDIFNQGFPVLFLYQALKAENRLTLEEELQISYIYQRLLSYQSQSGFSRFRKEAPNVLYSTLGLWMLSKMKPFQSWQSPQKESKLIADCKKMILKQHQNEGSFLPFPSTFSITEEEQQLTSFIYWVLRETNVPQDKLFEIKKSLHNRIPDKEKAFDYALHLLALSKDGPVSAEEFATLQSSDLSEDLAIRALRIIALQGNYPKITEDIRCLLENKQSQGGWQSLFLNLFATQAFVVYHQQQKQENASIQFQLEDQTQTLEPGLIYTIPLPLQGNRSSWNIQTSKPLFCQLITTYYLPWDRSSASTTDTSLKVDYHSLTHPLEFPHWEAVVQFKKEANAFKAPVVLEIGIPPGFAPANLEELSDIFYIEHYEQTARHILVYLKSPSNEEMVPEDLNFSIRLRPQLRLKVQAPPSGYRELAFQGKTQKQFAENRIDTLSRQ